MNKINFQNGTTKVNASTFNTFQDNIDTGKVDKTGDTMTGALKIKNTSEFVGVEKTRIINSTNYIARFGVGQVGVEGAATLELSDASSNVLGKLEVRADGTIKNQKSGKFIAEVDTGFKDLTLASGITVGTITKQAKYKKTGGIVSVVGDVAGITKATTMIATLPEKYRPSCQMYFIGACSGQRQCRWVVTTSGSIILEWVSDSKYDSAWYGLNFSFPIS